MHNVEITFVRASQVVRERVWKRKGKILRVAVEQFLPICR